MDDEAAPSVLPTAETTRRSRAPLPGSVDVAIVGAGTGGLAAGAYLAQAGYSVAIFDSHYVAGGCATQFSRGPRAAPYLFDVGLHYIGDCGPGGLFRTLLEPLGIDLDYRPLDPDGFDTLVFPDFTFRIPADRDLYRQRLLDLFPAERPGIDRWLRFVSQVGMAHRALFDAGGRRTLGVVLRVLLRARLVARYERSTIGRFLDSCTRDPHLRAVILGQHGDYGLPPSEAAALVHGGTTAHYQHGAYYPAGGGQVMADRLAQTVEAHGGTVHLRCGIERILLENGRAVGVRTSPRRGESTEVRAKAVLSNADIKRTLLGLIGPEHLPRRWVRKVQEWEMPGGIFMTCLAVRDDLAARGMLATNYSMFDTYDIDDYYLSNRRSGQLQPRGACITSASLKDPGGAHHAPPGTHTVEVMALLPGDAASWGLSPEETLDGRYRVNEVYRAHKERLEAEMVARLEGLLPGVAEHIVFRESATPLSHTRFTRATDGAAYGLASTPRQLAAGRPDAKGPLPGLWLCGASTRTGHGIVGALSSGRIAAWRIARSLGRPLPPLLT